MSELEKYTDRELRERCVDKSLSFFKCVASDEQVVSVADRFFQYIKNGLNDPDNCVVEDDPTPPVNTGPGMSVIHRVLRDNSIPDCARQ